MRECPDRFYGKMEKVVHILTQTGHMDRMAAFVVETASIQDILRFQVRTFLLASFPGPRPAFRRLQYGKAGEGLVHFLT